MRPLAIVMLAISLSLSLACAPGAAATPRDPDIQQATLIARTARAGRPGSWSIAMADYRPGLAQLRRQRMETELTRRLGPPTVERGVTTWHARRNVVLSVVEMSWGQIVHIDISDT